MLMVYPVRKQWHKKIPSVTHVDGVGVADDTAKSESLYYDVIKNLGRFLGFLF